MRAVTVAYAFLVTIASQIRTNSERIAIMRATPPTPAHPPLRRVVSFWPLVFYGLSVIVGAGIYVAIGSVVERAGSAAPLSFLLAGIAAALTGLCYAELASRFPEASGAAAYVKHGFGSDFLALATGLMLAFAVALAAASIARGAVDYLAVLVRLPAPLLSAALVVLFTATAASGVRESVGFAAAMGVIEIAGLVAAAAAGFVTARSFDFGAMLPVGLSGLHGVVAGAFIAFFAFMGFETLTNMAEEVRGARDAVPRAILTAIGMSIVLYVAVSVSVVLADRGTTSPLLDLFEGPGTSIFAAVGSVAVANGVLVDIVMLARLFYGMADRGQLPAALATVDARTRTPLAATLLAGGMVLATALLLPFERLLVLTNTLTLAVFILVDVALWRIQRTSAGTATFRVPRWVPPVAAAVALALAIAEFQG
jgi:APA family basic amino acid/polyamine antiporter